MAVYYQTMTIISKGTHTCAIATAAYRSGSKLILNNLENGSKIDYIFDFSNKHGIEYSSIMAPSYTPEWMLNRQNLWQMVEDKFHTKLALEFTIALPEELTKEQNINLILDFTKNSFLARDVIADVNFHCEHQNNPHLHIMCPLKKLKINSSHGKNFIFESKNWYNSKILKSIRDEQANIINKHLEKNGYSYKISSKPDTLPKFNHLRPWL